MVWVMHIRVVNKRKKTSFRGKSRWEPKKSLEVPNHEEEKDGKMLELGMKERVYR
jgi:hypothetical protein